MNEFHARSPSRNRSVCGYFAGVIAAGLILKISQASGMPSDILQLESLFSGSVSYASGCVYLSFLPCFLTHLFIRRFHIRNVIFYLIAGSLICILVGGIVNFGLEVWNASNAGLNPNARVVPTRDIRFFVISGAIAGLLYWAIAGRFYPPKKIVTL